jgi:thiamine-monophosphate kinase
VSSASGEAVISTVGELGEFRLIRALASRMPAGPGAAVGIGDDSAVVTTPSGSVVAAVDMVLEGRHFLRSWSSGYDVGVKAAARSLADIAAMGAVPTALLTALGLPSSLPSEWALDLASGLAAEASRAGAGIVGGDTAAADSILVTVTALGDMSGMSPVLRSGARPGDVVAVCGVLGHSAAGYARLSAGFTEPEALVAAHLRPAPPYDAGPEAARLGATAMIDVSDGLLADLGHVATASGVSIDVLPARVVPPEDQLLFSSGTDNGGSSSSRLLHWALTGGEDHALVAAFPPAVILPERWRVIGTVGTAKGITVDGAPYAEAPGWQHFR